LENLLAPHSQDQPQAVAPRTVQSRRVFSTRSSVFRRLGIGRSYDLDGGVLSSPDLQVGEVLILGKNFEANHSMGVVLHDAFPLTYIFEMHPAPFVRENGRIHHDDVSDYRCSHALWSAFDRHIALPFKYLNV
jgi:hypothetical protein